MFTNRDCCYYYKTINRVSKKVITPNVLLFSNYVNSTTPFLLNTEIIYWGLSQFSMTFISLWFSNEALLTW